MPFHEERFRTDTDKWEAEVESLIGPTDILLYPLRQRYCRLAPLPSRTIPGLPIWSPRDSAISATWMPASPTGCRWGQTIFRMARRNLDGYRLYEDMIQTDPAKKRLSDLFDAAQDISIPQDPLR